MTLVCDATFGYFGNISVSLEWYTLFSLWVGVGSVVVVMIILLFYFRVVAAKMSNTMKIYLSLDVRYYNE